MRVQSSSRGGRRKRGDSRGSESERRKKWGFLSWRLVRFLPGRGHGTGQESDDGGGVPSLNTPGRRREPDTFGRHGALPRFILHGLPARTHRIERTFARVPPSPHRARGEACPPPHCCSTPRNEFIFGHARARPRMAPHPEGLRPALGKLDVNSPKAPVSLKLADRAPRVASTPSGWTGQEPRPLPRLARCLLTLPLDAHEHVTFALSPQVTGSPGSAKRAWAPQGQARSSGQGEQALREPGNLNGAFESESPTARSPVPRRASPPAGMVRHPPRARRQRPPLVVVEIRAPLPRAQAPVARSS